MRSKLVIDAASFRKSLGKLATLVSRLLLRIILRMPQSIRRLIRLVDPPSVIMHTHQTKESVALFEPPAA